MITLLDKKSNLFKDDPVRGHLSPEFRTTGNKMSFALDEDRAVVCVAFTDRVATTVEELNRTGDKVAMFYTVWSYDKGAGRQILEETCAWIKENSRVERFVTLSPQTNMAYRFHTRNGAELISVNDESINYEYF